MKNLLENLDEMERELETIQNSPPSNTSPSTGPDKLDAYEETLTNIASKLDTLLADLLEAEVMEYTYPEFLHSEEIGLALKSVAVAQGKSLQRRGRSLQEVLVIAILIVAVFLVGMTFGLWGSFFFGL